MKTFLVGASGSGKTVIGRKVAQRLGLVHRDTDAMLVEKEGAFSVTEIFSKKGEPYFRKTESEIVDSIFADQSDQVVSTGGGLPAIDGMMERLKRDGFTIYLFAPVEVLWSRLEMGDELRDRPLLRDRGIEALRNLCDRRSAIYQTADVTIDTAGYTVSQAVDIVCTAIMSRKSAE